MNGEAIDRPVSQEILKAVAETTGQDLTEVEPLYHVVDPDALDRLFADTAGSGRTDGYVEFTFAGCDVVVRGSGEVEVTERSVEVEVGNAAETDSGWSQTNHEGAQ